MDSYFQTLNLFLPHLFVVVVQLLSHVWFFVTPWTAARQPSLSFIISQGLLKLMSIESVMLSNHLILSHSLLRLLSFLPRVRVFFNESALHIRQPKIGAWASILPKTIQGWFPLELTGLISLKFKGLSIVFSRTTTQKQQFFDAELFLWSCSHTGTWLPGKRVLTIQTFTAKSHICFLIHCLPSIICSYKSLFYRL